MTYERKQKIKQKIAIEQQKVKIEYYLRVGR